MADVKISELTALTSPDGAEELVVNAGGTTKKLTIEDLFSGDNVKAKFGAGDDLQIYHDGLNSYIKDAGTGQLRIVTDGSEIALLTQGGLEYGVRIIQDGAVEMRHNDSTKLATTATGVDVTGTVTADVLDVSGASTVRSYLTNTGLANTGEKACFQWDTNANLSLQGRDSTTGFKANWYTIETSAADGYADNHIFYTGASSEKMRLTSTGIDVTGTATMDGLTTSLGIDVNGTDDLRVRFLKGGSFKGGAQVATTSGDMITGSAVDDLAIRSQSNMIFSTGGATERMRIDASGIVTKPYQPSFRAGSATSYTTGNTILHTIDFHDIGNNYNPANGRFTAPVAGVYYFGAQAISGSATSSTEENLKFQKNGVGVCDARARGYQSSSLHLKTVIELAAGDYITVVVDNGSVYATSSGFHNQFMGYLLG